jgi:hypothetical protein
MLPKVCARQISMKKVGISEIAGKHKWGKKGSVFSIKNSHLVPSSPLKHQRPYLVQKTFYLIFINGELINSPEN